jgi:hypothetical protein
MITDSGHWKSDLLVIGNGIKKRITPIRWTEGDFRNFEKEVMIGFYIIRKLIEAQKLSNALVSTKVHGYKIPNNGKKLVLLNLAQYMNHFDLSMKSKCKFDLHFISNQIIHSYIFSPFFKNDSILLGEPLEGIHFCSEKERNKFVYELQIQTLIDLFIKVGSNDPDRMIIQMDHNKNDIVITSFAPDDPPGSGPVNLEGP